MSYEIMRKINPNFQYKLTQNGKMIPIADLFCNFFSSIKFSNKSEEIQKVLASHICNKVITAAMA